MDIKRAYRFRFYPTPEQEQILARTFGCARFAYNHMLRLRTDAWMQRQERIGYHESSAELTALKKQPEYAWLNEVSSVPVQQALRHLQTAFANFFAKRARYPQFKRKDGKQSAEYTTSAFKWDGQLLKLAKMAEPLAIRWSRQIPKAAKVTTVTVSKDTAGRYFVSLLCDDAVAAKHEVSGKVGIDLGLSHFAILSTGEKVAAPNTFRKNEAKLAKLQRRLAKKQKGSNRRAKAKLKVARLHAKIADSRRDFLHKLSTRLINENQVIAVESLSVSNMQKNRCLSKSIADAGWSDFVRQLEYKARWYGRDLVGIDKWFPSSKRCSDCGHTMPKMPLNVRQWTCPECGSIHDRDINAARNVLAAGLAVSAHGEAVSPVSL
ncbi:IS200/IS605 family element transposase accessory protein TnpB [Candidimonas humi]|uniref:IS200/IS605 family element RNA-guided endonuclease TnpB n=1 Tax=Candidimonas humi TaxID=683355 RepID=A0ABV8NWG9_9BURK|nr:IS200/IS605 family element RNA-guided endonuclease TnpB [Candidimonas humi]MBV6304886.1 IS200/IS605 family element transposase accessory protein TnpB [Candidimonas humi]